MMLWLKDQSNCWRGVTWAPWVTVVELWLSIYLPKYLVHSHPDESSLFSFKNPWRLEAESLLVYHRAQCWVHLGSPSISSYGFSYRWYSDDAQLIVSFLPLTFILLHRCLADISLWMAADQLKLNPSKTQLRYSLGYSSSSQDLVIFLNNRKSDTEWNHGVTTDNQLALLASRWVAHASFSMTALGRSSCFFPQGQHKYFYSPLSF